MVRLVLTTVWVIIKVAFARLARGPLLPTWTLGTEIAIELIRTLAARIKPLGVPGVRSAIASLMRPPRERHGVRWERVDAGGVPSVWFVPDGATHAPVILYLHGGGYVTCSIETHRDILVRLARASCCRVLAIEYRLAPEFPFPAALDDAVSSYRWLLEQGVPPDAIFVAGDSAGGGLTLATLMALRDRGHPLPAAGLCVSPWTDLAATGTTLQANRRTDYLDPDLMPDVAKDYAGREDTRHPLISPLYGDAMGLPPLLIQAGAAEILLDDSRRMADKARAAGVDVTLEIAADMFHVWHGFGMVAPQGNIAVKRMGEYIRARTEKRPSAQQRPGAV